MEHLILDQMGGKRVGKETREGEGFSDRLQQASTAQACRHAQVFAARAACTGMQTRGLARVFNLYQPERY